MDKNEQHIKQNMGTIFTTMHCSQAQAVGLTAFPYLPHMQSDLSTTWIVMVTGHIGVFVFLQYLSSCHSLNLTSSIRIDLH